MILRCHVERKHGFYDHMVKFCKKRDSIVGELKDETIVPYTTYTYPV